MYARKVTVKLKPDMSAEFTKRLDGEVIPLLREQTGFQHEIAFAAKDGREAIGISLWDSRESAEAYGKTGYAEAMKMLKSVTDGAPHIEGYQVSASTLQKAPAAAVE